jgi:hypothetical protein
VCGGRAREALKPFVDVKNVKIDIKTKTAKCSVDAGKFDQDAALAALDKVFKGTTVAP